MKTLGMVSLKVRLYLLAVLAGGKRGRKLSRHDKLIAVFTFGHPLAEPGLRLLSLIVVGSAAGV